MINKRGMAFEIMFGFFAIVLMTYTTYLFNAGEGDISAEVGKPQMEMIKMYSEAEGEIFYLQECVKQRVPNGVYSFFMNGGVKTECGGEWKKGSSDCYPNLEGGFKKDIADSVSSCGNVKDVRVEGENYYVDMEMLKYERKEGNVEVKYDVPVIVEMKLGFKFKTLDDMKKKIFNCLKEKDFGKCAKEVNGLKVDVNGNLHSFSYDILKEEIIIFKDGKIAEEKPNFKFLVDSSAQGEWVEI